MIKKSKILTVLMIITMLCTSIIKVNAEEYDYDEAYVLEPEATCQRETQYIVYDENNEVYYKYEREYNDFGLCAKELYFSTNDNGELEENDLTIFEYDKQGRITKWDYYIYENKNAVLKQTTTYEYNGETGKETLILHEENRDLVVKIADLRFNENSKEAYRETKILNDKEEFETSSIRNTSYDNNSETTKTYYYNNNEINDGWLQTIDYDEFGREIRVFEASLNMESKEFDLDTYELRYSYDKSGEMIIESCFENGEPSKNWKDEYIFDDNGYIKEESRIMIGDDYSIGVKDIYERDENGMIITNTMYDYTENNEWVYEGKVENTYDSRGLKILEDEEYSFDGELEKSKTEYVYELVHLDLKAVKEDGYKTYYHCDKCNKNYSDKKGQNIIYDIDAWKINNKQAPLVNPTYVILGVIVTIVLFSFIFKPKKGSVKTK